jgi:hypothetical protein
MSSDAIDAADMLLMELSEQMAQLSQSGAAALASGNIAAAKTIINAMEKTQDFQSRTGLLKSEMFEIFSKFSSTTQEAIFRPDSTQESDGIARTQDRTDPALMNAKRAKILEKIETRHRVRLSRRSAAVYRSDDNKVGVVCTMSKWHAKNENYWYAYHPHQDDFLRSVNQGYFVLGMMDVDTAIMLPLGVIRDNLDRLNITTTPDGRRYWHIHISRSSTGNLSLQRARGERPLQVDQYVLDISD